jgi:hypothetical protein
MASSITSTNISARYIEHNYPRSRIGHGQDPPSPGADATCEARR